MATIERSNVAGTFASRAQAEETVAALQKAGFSHEAIGLAGQAEVLEKLRGSARVEANEPQLLHGELVTLAVRAEERWQEALTILLQHGASDTTPDPQEAERDDQERRRELAGVETVIEEHLEYDPITVPRVVLEEVAPVAYSGDFGLKRDPRIDSEAPTSGPYVEDDTTAPGKSTFFGGMGESRGPDSDHGPSGEPSRVR